MTEKNILNSLDANGKKKQENLFISNNSLEEITQHFINNKRSREISSSLTLFLLFKASGISERKKISLSDIETKNKLHNAINLVMSYYAPWEKLSKKYSLIFPFDPTWYGGQSGSIGNRNRWIKPSNINNLLRNAPNKYRWVTTTIEGKNTSYSLSYNYLNELVEFCNLKGAKKINISYLAGWTLKYLNLSSFISLNTSNLIKTKQLVKILIKIFNFNKEELRSIFNFNNRNIIELAKIRPDIENYVRKYIGYKDDNDAKIYINEKIKIDNKLDKTTIMIPKINISNHSLEEIKEYLLTSKQIILFGPVGTGKTYTAEQLRNEFKDFIYIQFHQNYGYEEFIGSLTPREGELVPVDGILVKFIENKVNKDSNSKFLIIIDEINRGNISKIFGEMISLLDRDRKSIKLSYNPKKELKLPPNLFIIGTMNSVDRSIALVDYALRRRFEFIYFQPDKDLLDNVTNDGSHDLEGISIPNLFEKINDNILENLGKDFCLGHTFYMPSRIKKENEFIWNLKELERTINNTILPFLEEYCFGNDSLLISIIGDELINRLTGEDFKRALINFLG